MAKYNQDFLYNLSAKLFDNIESLIDELNIPLQVYGDRYTGPCPIHTGDNQNAFSIKNGVWTCFTHHCEKTFNRNMIGLIRGVLSNRNGWASDKDKPLSFSSTLNWIFAFLKVDRKAIFSYNTGTKTDSIFLKRKTNSSKLTRSQVRQRLQFPAEFLLKRGFNQELLDAYDIGVCFEKGKPMSGRVVVPIFDDSYKYMVGCLGRTINSLCNNCNKYHFGKCPKYESSKFNKWINSSGFYADSYLFNYWKASNAIKEEGKVILVEGPLDCLNLVQNGVENVLGLFGNTISDEQTILLERFPLQEIQILTDNDEPGKKGKEKIREQCKHLCKIKIIEYNKHDPGELTKEEIECLKQL